LLNRGIASGRQIAQQVRLPFGLVAEMLRRNKEERLLVYRGEAAMTDYMYELTELGIERARRYSAQCTYFGAAPVPLDQYTEGVKAQSVRKQQPRMTDMERAFADLVLSEAMLIQLGQAISSGLGVFLYGAPGNGKTSIAERVTDTLGDAIWIPRAISISGEIIRLYDPISHQACDPEDESQIDGRWIRIRRPTILVGGELTMENLEITTNVATGINEAPLQLKANGGVLVLDDFGRQRISPIDLLNRWIVPLEKRHDYLNLPSGRKIEVPFDELIIFATNLEPQSLVDEAFLRRIPYKIDVTDPTDAEFRALFRRSAEEFGMEYSPGPIDYLIQRHYKTGGRPMRFCHPRDLVHHMQTFCKFLDLPMEITDEAVDAAVKNYFAMI
jgi:predicted ATPase with chaperone activity